jgi:hypothetical protein
LIEGEEERSRGKENREWTTNDERGRANGSMEQTPCAGLRRTGEPSSQLSERRLDNLQFVYSPLIITYILAPVLSGHHSLSTTPIA